MKIRFEFEVNSFIDAAELEELFNKNEIKYKVSVEGNKTTTKRKRPSGSLRRKRISKEELATVVLCIKTNPTWGDPKISKKTNVSQATVRRIRGGTHVLQQKGK